LIQADEFFDSLSMNGNLQLTFMLCWFILSYLRTPRNPPTSMVEASRPRTGAGEDGTCAQRV
jgi:hypothetical protein